MIPYLILAACILLGIAVLTTLYYLVSFVAVSYGSGDTNAEHKGKEKRTGDAATHHTENLKAVMRCSVIPPGIGERFNTTGYPDCRSRNQIFNGNTLCEYGCLGAGSCADLCPNNAITLKGGTISINDYCNGCGYCVTICPRKLIELVPVSDIRTLYCAASGKQDLSAHCPVAADNYSIH
jgi:ferredoxin